jgi:hypothetical protein
VRAAAFTVEDLYCNVTEGPSGALNILQGNYSHLPTEKDNLISCELKLGTSGEKNVRDAQKACLPPKTRSIFALH